MIPPQETTGLRESREYHERRGVTESDWRQTHRGSEGTRQTRQRQTPILKQPSSYWGKRTAYSNVFPRPTSGKSPPAGGVGISGGVDGGGGGAGDISSRVIQPRQYEVPPFALAGARGGVIDWETPVPLARGAESGNSYSSSLTPSSSPATSKDTILAVDLTPRTSTSARSRFEAGYIAALASRETGHRCRKARGAATVTVLTKSEEKQMEKRDAPLDRGSDCSEEFSNRATNEDCTKRTRGLGCKNMAPTSIHAVDSEGRPQMDGLSMVECDWLASRNNIPKAVVSLMSKQVARTAEVFKRAAAPMVSVAERAHGATRSNGKATMRISSESTVEPSFIADFGSSHSHFSTDESADSVRISRRSKARGRKLTTRRDDERYSSDRCKVHTGEEKCSDETRSTLLTTTPPPCGGRRSSRSRSRSPSIYQRPHSSLVWPRSRRWDSLEQSAVGCRPTRDTRLRSCGDRERASHHPPYSVEWGTRGGDGWVKHTGSEYLVPTAYPADGRRRGSRSREHEWERDDNQNGGKERSKSQHSRARDLHESTARSGEHHHSWRSRKRDNMKERSNDHGNERPSRHDKRQDRKSLNRRSSPNRDSSYRNRRPLRSPCSSLKSPVDQTVTARWATTTREPWQPLASPKMKQSNAHRKQARPADTVATMDAVLDAMESDSGGPSRTIFPSHMAEVAASSVAGDATKTRKGESTAGATVGDAGLAGYRVRGDGRVDQVLEEGRALELQEVEKLMTTDSSTSTKARDIRSLMIHKASVKLPRDVHRAILDLFQVTILEPDYYPPDAELEGLKINPPTYVIGPALHVPLAFELLREFHNRDPMKRLEATVTNVMYRAMDKSLLIRRPDATDSRKISVVFGVTPDGANSLLDKGRLAWLTSECCRLTGATSMIASREELFLKHRKSKSKVTVVGTLGQCVEVSKIVREALMRYPLVESFMHQCPRPLQLPESGPKAGINLRAGAAEDGRCAERKAVGAASIVEDVAKRPPRREAPRFGQGLRSDFRRWEPVLPSEAPHTFLDYMQEWTDDGRGLPAGMLARKQVQMESVQHLLMGTAHNYAGTIEPCMVHRGMWNTESDSLGGRRRGGSTPDKQWAVPTYSHVTGATAFAWGNKVTTLPGTGPRRPFIAAGSFTATEETDAAGVGVTAMKAVKWKLAGRKRPRERGGDRNHEDRRIRMDSRSPMRADGYGTDDRRVRGRERER